MTDAAEMKQRLEHYVGPGLSVVTGWFERTSAEVISAILQRQLEVGIVGNVAEIGVHHGRSFLLLANGLRDDERGVALDIFGDQERNVDHSGRGDRAAFEANLKQWADPAKVDIRQTASTDVPPEQAVETFGKVRLFSVDGGHTAAITAHDLKLAESCLVDQGVVVLDDIFNPAWLGVITGLRNYLDEADGALIPFATSANKLYLARPDAVSTYIPHLRTAVPDLVGKTGVEFFGGLIDVYGSGLSPRARAARAKAAANSPSAKLDAALYQARQDLARAEERVRALECSTSWKLTAPVRAAGTLARRARGRFGR